MILPTDRGVIQTDGRGIDRYHTVIYVPVYRYLQSIRYLCTVVSYVTSTILVWIQYTIHIMSDVCITHSIHTLSSAEYLFVLIIVSQIK